MPNVHMQTAARDLELAVSDLRQQEQSIRYQTDNQKREIAQTIADLRAEEARLRAQAAHTDDDSVKLASGARVSSIHVEIKDLEKRQFSLEEDTRRHLQDIENQALQLDSLARQLQMMA